MFNVCGMATAEDPIVLSDSEDERPLKRRPGKEPADAEGAAAASGAAAGGAAAGSSPEPEIIEIDDVQVRCCACDADVDQDETTTSSECSHPVCMSCLQALVQKAGQDGSTGPVSQRLVCPCSKPECSGQLRFSALGCAPKGAVKQDAPTKLEKQLFAEVKEKAAGARTAQKGCSCGAQMKSLSDDKVSGCGAGVAPGRAKEKERKAIAFSRSFCSQRLRSICCACARPFTTGAYAGGGQELRRCARAGGIYSGREEGRSEEAGGVLARRREAKGSQSRPARD